MKKAIVILAVAFFTGNSVMAQVDSTTTTTTTTKTTKYLYYPDANVYYNETTKSYIYMDPANNNTWTTVNQLPSTIVIDQGNKNEIVYSGKDIWKMNAEHKKKYYKAMKKAAKS